MSSCVQGRKVYPLCYLPYAKRRDAHTVVLGMFAHLNTGSTCTHIDAQTELFGVLTDILEVQKLTHAAHPCLIMLADSTASPSDLSLCSMGSF